MGDLTALSIMMLLVLIYLLFTGNDAVDMHLERPNALQEFFQTAGLMEQRSSGGTKIPPSNGMLGDAAAAINLPLNQVGPLARVCRV